MHACPHPTSLIPPHTKRERQKIQEIKGIPKLQEICRTVQEMLDIHKMHKTEDIPEICEQNIGDLSNTEKNTADTKLEIQEIQDQFPVQIQVCCTIEDQLCCTIQD